MRNQKGFTFWSLSMTFIAAGFVAVIGMKLIPAYLEFFSVKKALATLKKDPNFNQMNKGDLQLAYSKTARIDNIRAVAPDDLDVSKDESGATVVSVEYQVKIPMVYNITALLDFAASTDASAASPAKAE